MLTQKRRAKQLINYGKSSFQTNGVTESSFDRMLLDKLKWAKGSFAGGYMFAFFGVGSIIGYGLSLVMEKQNYDYHFKYTASSKFF